MTTWITLLRRAIVSVLLAVACVLLLASPGSAHAELVKTTPANGQRLETAPAKVTLAFSESVNLLEDGISLLNSHGATVSTPDPTVDGHTVTWPMPKHLRNGPYVVTWRVISSDGHPVDGAFSFGVGAAARAVPGAVSATESTAQTAPWQVVGARLVGYLAFAVVAGLIGFLVWCALDKAGNPALQRLTRWALSVGLVTTLAAMVIEGPYSAGVSMSGLLDPHLFATTLRTPWGVAMAGRFALLLALSALIWRLPGLVNRTRRWLASGLVVVIAAAIAAAGHGSASGPLDLGIVSAARADRGDLGGRAGRPGGARADGGAAGGSSVRHPGDDVRDHPGGDRHLELGPQSSLARPAVPDPVRPAAGRQDRSDRSDTGRRCRLPGLGPGWPPAGGIGASRGRSDRRRTHGHVLVEHDQSATADRGGHGRRHHGERRPRLRERARADVVGPPRHRWHGHHPRHHQGQPAPPAAHRPQRRAVAGH